MFHTRHIRLWLTSTLMGGILMLPVIGESLAAEENWIVDETTSDEPPGDPSLLEVKNLSLSLLFIPSAYGPLDQ